MKDENRTVPNANIRATHGIVDNIDDPYDEESPFGWTRGYHVGGRSLTWGRQSNRYSELDFETNARDGYVRDWPIR